jgi:hypothetical protein
LETARIRHWYPLYLLIDDAMQMTGLGLKREELEKLVVVAFIKMSAAVPPRKESISVIHKLNKQDLDKRAIGHK